MSARDKGDPRAKAREPAPLTPEMLAGRHPRLYHYAQAGASAGVRRHGLLSAACAVTLWGTPEPERLLGARRPRPVPLDHPTRGRLWLNDNAPLSMVALERCLDGMTPEGWLAALAARVFFYVREGDGKAFARARIANGLPTERMAFDTLGLARAHWGRMAISPINSGATVRRPPRRGPSTFAPVNGLDWQAWRRARGLASPDTIREVTVLDAVPDAADHLLEVQPVP